MDNDFVTLNMKLAKRNQIHLQTFLTV